ncbi:hypothetical protein [Pseudoalteromonas xiamenensis]
MKTFTTICLAILFSSSYTNAEECNFSMLLSDNAKKTHQVIDMKNGQKLIMTQWLQVETQSKANAKLATNIICQSIQGRLYTGSNEEWSQFINSAAQGLVQAQAKNIEFTLVGTDDATYQGTMDNREYQFVASIGRYKQVIKNITLLNNSKDEVMTISVSGNEAIADNINQEYKRIVSQLK